jgi:hypothetical protein
MSEAELSKEELILRAVKGALTRVIKDTATQPGMIHPLSQETIDELRNCMFLISNREKELADAGGREWNLRPHYTDENKPQGDVVIPLHKSGLVKDKPKG